ncbi:MAG: hypothetical protein NWF10_04585 [Candidatus Bathyarchaeota archaeon]|nr:hypothetical protein [Candidatus Bathyarchaeota archaeon]
MSKSSFFVVAIFFFAFYESYYFLFSNLLEPVVPFGLDSLVVQGALHFFTAIILLFGSIIIQKFNKLKIIYFCSIINCLLTLLLLGNLFEGFRLIILFGLVLFVSLGMLTTLGVFGILTVPEERGRVGGLIGFAVFVLFFIVNYFVVLNLDFFGSILLGLILNALPLVGLILKSIRFSLGSVRKQPDLYFERRVFILYFIPWIVFSLINVTLAANTSAIIQQQISDSLHFTLISVQVAGVVFGVLLGGLVADLLGRRFSLVFSLTFFGFCTALVGLFASDLVFLVVYGASGLSWGILFVLYIFVVWGDLSNQQNGIKIYSIGLITYFLSSGVGFFVDVSMPIFQSALLSVMIIFILNLPVIFAPELLSSHVLDKIRMKMHMGAVKKLQKKNQG